MKALTLKALNPFLKKSWKPLRRSDAAVIPAKAGIQCSHESNANNKLRSGFLVRSAAMLAAISMLTACASNPPPPDWQANAKGAMERYLDAYLSGNSRVATLEFDKARREIARTGRPDLLARAELTRCAAQIASLVIEPCAGFEALRADAAPPELAYASYLATRPQAGDVALLPEQHRSVAGMLVNASGTSPDPAALRAITDPLSRLIAIGVLFQTSRASPAVIALAVETASAQGWQRSLLAWLSVQKRLAEQAGQSDEAQRLQRRMDLMQVPARAP
jgi:hypothetical protein